MMDRLFRPLLLVSALVAALYAAGPAASVAPPAAPEPPAARCARLALPSVLLVTVGSTGAFGEKRESYGTAFAVGDRHALTCLHVTGPASSVMLTDDAGVGFAADVVASDKALDLALLRPLAGKGLTPLPWARSAGLPRGTPLVAIGSPWGLAHSVSSGVLSHPSRTLRYLGRERKGLLQSDAAVNPGNSGGPLLTLDGKAVGVVCAVRDPGHGLGFAVPADLARRWAEKAMRADGTTPAK